MARIVPDLKITPYIMLNDWYCDIFLAIYATQTGDLPPKDSEGNANFLRIAARHAQISVSEKSRGDACGHMRRALLNCDGWVDPELGGMRIIAISRETPPSGTLKTLVPPEGGS